MLNFFKMLLPSSYTLLLCMTFSLFSDETLFLRDNLLRAVPGDYLVISTNKTDTLMHIYDKKENIITIEEIAVPESVRKTSKLSWAEWVQQNAPGQTSWVMYDINASNGKMLRYYSFTKNNWFEIAEADNFLTKLLNLRFVLVPENARKKVGPKPISGPEWRSIWQPRLIIEGKIIPDVKFDAWRTKWPKDGTDLSGKTIEVYLPKDNQSYSSYFPYWLQISGTIGKAKIRIIDSGKNLKSPKPLYDSETYQQIFRQPSN